MCVYIYIYIYIYIYDKQARYCCTHIYFLKILYQVIHAEYVLSIISVYRTLSKSDIFSKQYISISCQIFHILKLIFWYMTLYFSVYMSTIYIYDALTGFPFASQAEKKQKTQWHHWHDSQDYSQQTEVSYHT